MTNEVETYVAVNCNEEKESKQQLKLSAAGDDTKARCSQFSGMLQYNVQQNGCNGFLTA
jgi:hypothetical protein